MKQMTSHTPLLNPVSRSRLHDEIVGRLQSEIICGKLSAGSKLPPERVLAEGFGVNRGTLREALKKLEMLGLVEIRHGDGVYVKNHLESGSLDLLKSMINADDSHAPGLFMNLLEIRKILVPEMAAHAALNRSENDLKTIESILQSDKSILEKDLSLHHALALSSKNMAYIFILNFFNQIFRDYGNYYFNDDTNAKHSAEFHCKIYKAVKEKNAKNAKKIMYDILAYTEKQFKEGLNKKTFTENRGGET